ncbi:hypothetical protein EJ08DRAFT_699289 [Tothia fuscella]|uniref:DUF7918 domain-containing protein n=1 Tax=Tothia fuscella TaxID=1048955 RepID=A0A9P4NMY7_9PEZI|nr:hypothetical protein EJ08DRAFT_699289 [Tothia fuscella]
MFLRPRLKAYQLVSSVYAQNRGQPPPKSKAQAPQPKVQPPSQNRPPTDKAGNPWNSLPAPSRTQGSVPQGGWGATPAPSSSRSWGGSSANPTWGGNGPNTGWGQSTANAGWGSSSAKTSGWGTSSAKPGSSSASSGWGGSNANPTPKVGGNANNGNNGNSGNSGNNGNNGNRPSVITPQSPQQQGQITPRPSTASQPQHSSPRHSGGLILPQSASSANIITITTTINGGFRPNAEGQAITVYTTLTAQIPQDAPRPTRPQPDIIVPESPAYTFKVQVAAPEPVNRLESRVLVDMPENPCKNVAYKSRKMTTFETSMTSTVTKAPEGIPTGNTGHNGQIATMGATKVFQLPSDVEVRYYSTSNLVNSLDLIPFATSIVITGAPLIPSLAAFNKSLALEMIHPDGIKVLIRRRGDDKPYEEYLNPAKSPSDMVRYIAVNDGEQFEIFVKTTENFDFCSAPRIRIHTSIDGGVLNECRYRSLDKMRKEDYIKSEGSMLVDGVWVKSTLIFSTLKLDSDPYDEPKQVELIAKQLGCIQISIGRGKEIKLRKSYQWASMKEAKVTASKQLIKVAGISESIRPAQDARVVPNRTTRSRFEPLNGVNGRKLTFTFLYRTKMTLNVKGIAPFSPVTEASNDKALSDPNTNKLSLSNNVNDTSLGRQKSTGPTFRQPYKHLQMTTAIETQSSSTAIPPASATLSKEKLVVKLKTSNATKTTTKSGSVSSPVQTIPPHEIISGSRTAPATVFTRASLGSSAAERSAMPKIATTSDKTGPPIPAHPIKKVPVTNTTNLNAETSCPPKLSSPATKAPIPSTAAKSTKTAPPKRKIIEDEATDDDEIADPALMARMKKEIKQEEQNRNFIDLTAEENPSALQEGEIDEKEYELEMRLLEIDRKAAEARDCH